MFFKNTNSMDINQSFSNFYAVINNILDIHVPFKKLSKREINLNKSKPWITKGILKSIKINIHQAASQVDLYHFDPYFFSNTSYQTLLLNHLKLRFLYKIFHILVMQDPYFEVLWACPDVPNHIN